MFYDDPADDYLRKLKLHPLVTLNCMYCPARFTGLDEAHARALLAIHTEGTCQGEVRTDGRSDPARDLPRDPADVPRLTLNPRPGAPPTPGRD